MTALALILYIGTIALLTMGAFVAAPLTVNPKSYLVFVSVVAFIQIFSVSYLLSKGFKKSE